jgi:hypothetical protein
VELIQSLALEVEGTKTYAHPGQDWGLSQVLNAVAWLCSWMLVLPFNHGLCWRALLAGILTFASFPPPPGYFCRTRPMTKGVRCIHGGHGLRMEWGFQAWPRQPYQVAPCGILDEKQPVSQSPLTWMFKPQPPGSIYSTGCCQSLSVITWALEALMKGPAWAPCPSSLYQLKTQGRMKTEKEICPVWSVILRSGPNTEVQRCPIHPPSPYTEMPNPSSQSWSNVGVWIEGKRYASCELSTMDLPLSLLQSLLGGSLTHCQNHVKSLPERWASIWLAPGP